ncbi:MAG: S9 family peptidase [Vicinamibacterales bacterium]
MASGLVLLYGGVPSPRSGVAYAGNDAQAGRPIRVMGGPRVPAFNLEEAVRTAIPGQFTLSADGRSAAYSSFPGSRYFGHPIVALGSEDTNIRVVSLASGHVTLVTSGASPKTNPRFSPAGDRVIYEAEDDIWIADLSTGRTQRLTTDQAPDGDAVWSPDGKRIAFVSARSGWAAATTPLPIRPKGRRIWVMTPDGDRGTLVQLTSDTVGASDLSWSPRGDEILFVAPGAHYFARQVFVVSARGGAVPRRLTPNDASWNTLPRWSPDGSRIAFISDRSGYRSLWIMKADGTGARQVLNLEQDQDYNHNEYIQTKSLFWSPDGSRILCFAIRGGALDLYVVSVVDGRAERVTNGEGSYHPVGWVDAKTIAYVYENHYTPPDLYVRPLGSAPRQVTHTRRAAFRESHFANQERFSFKATDGVGLQGYIHTPRRMADGERLAAIVFAHTYCPGQNYHEWDPFLSYLVESGYVVLRLDHRGSSGYGRAFLELAVGEHGGKIVQDIVDGARYLQSLSYVDSRRLGIIGYSFGGSLVNFGLVKAPDLFRAGVSVFGTVDRRFQRRRSWEYYLGPEEEAPERYAEASPITFVQDLRSPLLLIGGQEDTIVDTTQTYRYADALRRAGKSFELLMYPGERHGLRDVDHQIDSYERVLTFLERFLGPAAAVQVSRIP